MASQREKAMRVLGWASKGVYCCTWAAATVPDMAAREQEATLASILLVGAGIPGRHSAQPGRRWRDKGCRHPPGKEVLDSLAVFRRRIAGCLEESESAAHTQGRHSGAARWEPRETMSGAAHSVVAVAADHTATATGHVAGTAEVAARIAALRPSPVQVESEQVEGAARREAGLVLVDHMETELVGIAVQTSPRTAMAGPERLAWAEAAVRRRPLAGEHSEVVGHMADRTRLALLREPRGRHWRMVSGPWPCRCPAWTGIRRRWRQSAT